MNSTRQACELEENYCGPDKSTSIIQTSDGEVDRSNRNGGGSSLWLGAQTVPRNEEDDSDETSGHGEISSHHSLKEAPLANRETRAVVKWKLVVLLVLLLSAITTALSVYYYIHNSETAQFHEAFDNSAFKVLEAVGISFEKTLKSMDSLAVAMVSQAISTNQTWPYVTVPEFAILAAKMISNSDSIFLTFAPLISSEARAQWERYSVTHNQWVNETVHLQEDYSFYHGPLEYDTAVYDGVIYGDFGPVEYGERDLLPTWQSFPVALFPGTPTYNWDYLSSLDISSLVAALSHHRVIISEAFLLPDPLDSVEVEEARIWSEWYRLFVQPGQPSDEPVSDIYFPVFDKLDGIHAPYSIQNNEGYDLNTDGFVGLLAASVFWRDLITDILPPGNEGIVVVFENPCNPTFTYKINGPMVEYLGRGDFHDPAYDNLERSSNFFDLNSFASGISLYSGPPVNKEYCPFRLRVYPSDEMKNDYSSSDPVIFAVAAVCIFFFTSAMFLLYDCNVEKRQRLVMHTAERSTAIVSSLFPVQVQEQLADSVIGDKPKKNEKGLIGHVLSSNQQSVKQFLEQGDQNGIGNESQSLLRSSKPIASLYPDTTIMFADIAGFTQWSSKRQPCDVFTLLETLYGAFDAIALRRKVFKVETIGDCYVAVTGLPTPEARHAVVMAKFAMDCRNKLQEVTRELEATLGPDTGSLALRIGLHSGPTTAGVLRGAKSRFQLFGDTVNTSARMESNGLPNKIHVSQATADLLVAAGKGFWLVKRDELIEAKGKGEMQTWWVNPTSSGPGSVATSCGEGSTLKKRSKEINDGIATREVDSLSDEEEEIDDGIEMREDEAITMNVQALQNVDDIMIATQGSVSTSDSSDYGMVEL